MFNLWKKADELREKIKIPTAAELWGIFNLSW